MQALEFQSADKKLHVTSAWMRVFENVGYSIPLWQEDGDPELYPKPRVSLLFSAKDGEEARAELLEPQKLCFFHWEGAPAGSNPRTWPPFYAIDFDNSKAEAPPWDRKNTNDGASPEGQLSEAFHFRLSASDRAINILHGRGAKECATEVESLHFVRGGVTSLKGTDLFDKLSLLAQAQTKLDLRALREHLSDPKNFEQLTKKMKGVRTTELGLFRLGEGDVQEWLQRWISLPSLRVVGADVKTTLQAYWDELTLPHFDHCSQLALELSEALETFDSEGQEVEAEMEATIAPLCQELCLASLRLWGAELEGFHSPTSQIYQGLGIPWLGLVGGQLFKVLEKTVDLLFASPNQIKAVSGALTGLLTGNFPPLRGVIKAQSADALCKSLQDLLSQPLDASGKFDFPQATFVDFTALDKLAELVPKTQENFPEFAELCQSLLRFLARAGLPDYAAFAARFYPDLQEIKISHSLPSLIKMVGAPPELPGLQLRFPEAGPIGRRIGFYFQSKLGDLPHIGLPPLISGIKLDNFASLAPFQLDTPTLNLEGLTGKFTPPAIPNSAIFKTLALSELIPKFAGLDIEDLFPELNLERLELNDPVKLPKFVTVRHGVDKGSRRGWLEVDIQFDYPKDTPLFKTAIASLTLKHPKFRAFSRLDVDEKGQLTQVSHGSIEADWVVEISGQPLVLIKKTALRFDESGKLRFDLDPTKFEFPDALSFLTDLAKDFLPKKKDSGLSFEFTPNSATALLALPIPSLSAGPFGLSDLNFGFSFGLDFRDNLIVFSRFNLSSQQKPFTLLICALGGSGWLDLGLSYHTKNRKLAYSIDLALAAAAGLSFSFGPVSGGIFVNFGVRVSLSSEKPSALSIDLFLSLRGNLDLCGIVTVDVSLTLSATYESSGVLRGRGELDVSVEISFFYTFEYSESIEIEFEAPELTDADAGQHCDRFEQD